MSCILISIHSLTILEGLLVLLLSSLKMESVTAVKILDVVFCISIHANAFEKHMNPLILNVVLGK